MLDALLVLSLLAQDAQTLRVPVRQELLVVWRENGKERRVIVDRSLPPPRER